VVVVLTIVVVMVVHQSWQIMTRSLVVQMVLKCADIGHLAVSPKTHKRWALLLEEEFFRQVCFLPDLLSLQNLSWLRRVLECLPLTANMSAAILTCMSTPAFHVQMSGSCCSAALCCAALNCAMISALLYAVLHCTALPCAVP